MIWLKASRRCATGITRERLESLDRKITCEPEDFPDKRAALITDFQRYLGIIKAVHEGADLQARHCAMVSDRACLLRAHRDALARQLNVCHPAPPC